MNELDNLAKLTKIWHLWSNQGDSGVRIKTVKDALNMKTDESLFLSLALCPLWKCHPFLILKHSNERPLPELF